MDKKPAQISYVVRLDADWYESKNQNYVTGSDDYSEAKQNLKASLRKSDYFNKVPNSQKKLMYRILEDDETKERKRLKNELKKKKKLRLEVPNFETVSVDSGFDSARDSPPSRNSDEPTNKNFVTSGGNGLSPVSRVFEKKAFLETNDYQQTSSFTSGGLDGFLMPQNMDDVSAENSVVVPDTNALYENEFSTQSQSFGNQLGLTNYTHSNPEYPSPYWEFTKNSPQHPKYVNSGLDVIKYSSEYSKSPGLDLIQNSPEYPKYPSPGVDAMKYSPENLQCQARSLNLMGYSPENPKYSTSGLNSIECLVENPWVNRSGSKGDCCDEKARERWNYFQVVLSDKDLDNLIATEFSQALNVLTNASNNTV